MRNSLAAIVLMVTVLSGWGAESRGVRPFETGGGSDRMNAVDTAVRSALRKRGIKPANLCSDEVFVRRVYLDVIGSLPTEEEVVAFLSEKRSGKRARLIDSLFEREEFADYWSLKWCDLLRVKAEFPINLWPNAVQAYHRCRRSTSAARSRAGSPWRSPRPRP
jgi:hypothetical protein